MLPKTYPLLSNYSTCLSPMSTLSLNWGMLLWNPCLGLQWWPHWDPFPKSKYFKLSKPDQNDKTGPEILLTAHATSLTKEPCLAFVAVEQPSIFKPCQKFTASPFPYSMMFKQETCVLKNIYWSSHIGNSVGEAKIQRVIQCFWNKDCLYKWLS